MRNGSKRVRFQCNDCDGVTYFTREFLSFGPVARCGHCKSASIYQSPEARQPPVVVTVKTKGTRQVHCRACSSSNRIDKHRTPESPDPKCRRCGAGLPETTKRSRAQKRARRQDSKREAKSSYRKRGESLASMGFKSYDSYLQSATWRRIRREKLQADPACECCPAEAECVHHTSYSLAVLQGDDVAHLVSLCIKCHHDLEFNAHDRKRRFPDVVRRTIAAVAKRQGEIAAESRRQSRRADGMSPPELISTTVDSISELNTTQ